MPAAPGTPRDSPPDPGHGGESAGDGRAGIMPTPGRPGRGEPGDHQVPGQVPHPARTPAAGIGRDAVRALAADAGRRQAGQRGIWPASPGGG
jgi:hypothetical protein